MSEQEERQAVLDAATSWLGTPFHHGARIKRVGVDCANLIAAVFEETGLEPPIEIPSYPKNWFLFGSQEILLHVLSKRAREIPKIERKPADIVVYQFGRCYSHAGIVTKTTEMIHAFYQEGKVNFGTCNQGIFAKRKCLYFRRAAWGR